MFRPQMWGAFDRHRAADELARLRDLLPREAECGQDVKPGRVDLLLRETELVVEEIAAERPAVEDEREFERPRELGLDSFDRLLGKPFRLEGGGRHVRAALERARPATITHDLLDLPRRIAELRQGRGDRR